MIFNNCIITFRKWNNTVIFIFKVSLINFFKSLSEFNILAASWINTYFALIFDFKSAFLTLNVLVFPPFMSSIFL